MMKLTVKHFIMAVMIIVMTLSSVSAAPADTGSDSGSDTDAALASYEIVRDEPDKKYADAEVYFERPVFDDTMPGYQKINNFFENLSKKFFDSDSVSFLWEQADELQGIDNLDLECYSKAEVVYQTDRLVCIKCFRMECYGGTDSFWNEGYLFQTESGERLGLFDVTDKTEKEIKDLINAEVKNQYPEIYNDPYNNVKEAIMNYPFDELCFYVDQGVIHISFAKYELAPGPAGMIDLSLKDLPLVAEATDKTDHYVIAPLKSEFNPGDIPIYLKLRSGFDFLDKSSSEMNWELALTSAVLSNEIYEAAEVSDNEYESIVQDTLISLGYTSTSFYYVPEGNGNRPVCCFAHAYNEGKNVFAIVVRGTQTIADVWATDIVNGGFRFFEEAANNTCDYFIEFAQTVTGKTIEQLEKEDNRFLIAGHSLGGAVANRLSINENTILKMASNDKNNIYTYTFESPYTCQNYWWINPEEKSNAFNFKDVDDAIPNLPPWFGSARYGTDFEFSVDPDSEIDHLSDDIFQKLFPNARGGSVNEAPEKKYFKSGVGIWTLGHHNIGLPLTYIIQHGIKDGTWNDVYDVLHKVVAAKESHNDIMGKWTKEYGYHVDENGNVLNDTVYKTYEDGKVERTENEYNDEGELVTEKSFDDSKLDSKTEYEYNSNGKLVKETHYSGYDSIDLQEWTEYEYNDDGDKIKESTYDILDGVPSLSYYTDYEYDDNRNMIKRSYYSIDENQNAVPGDWDEYSYDEDGKKITYSYSVFYEGKVHYGQENYEYDTNGNMIKITYEGTDQSSWTDLEYDSDGNKIKETTYDRDGNVVEWHAYKYDGWGNLVKADYYPILNDGNHGLSETHIEYQYRELSEFMKDAK